MMKGVVMATPENKSFLDELMRRSNEKYEFLSFVGSDDSWREAKIPEMPVSYKASYRYRASQGDAAITFELNGDDVKANTLFFQRLEMSQKALEKALGAPLVWRDEDDDLKKRRMIRWDFKGLGYKHIQSKHLHLKTLVDAMIRFDTVLRPYLINALQTVET